MAGRLEGKVVIITGTGGSMGRAAALTFAREGALIVGSNLTVDDCDATVTAVRAAGGQMVSLHPSDLSKSTDSRRLVDLAIQTYGRIDVVFISIGWKTFPTRNGIATGARKSISSST